MDRDLATIEEHAELEQEHGSFSSFLRELPVLVVTAVVVAWLVKSFIIQPFVIPSGSMEPTLVPGDRVLVTKFLYRFRDPQPGDIIVFIPPNDATKDFIKRVVAVGGQKLEVKSGKVYIDGRSAQEPSAATSGDLSNYGPLVIPAGSVFVMGDNRPNSMDGRVFGPIKTDKILGEAFTIYWPPDRIHWLR